MFSCVAAGERRSAPRSEEGGELDREIEAFAADQGATLAFGAYEAEGGLEYNAVFFLPQRPDRAERASYRKANLFPFTEWLPWPLERPWIRRLLPWAGAWTPGSGPRVVRVSIGGREVVLGPLLCYDAVRAGHVAEEARQGAELLLALSNDSWFTGTRGPALHLAVATFRAIETRLPLVRAANTGISALVDPSGEVLATAEMDRRAALLLSVSPGRVLSPPYLWLGRFFGPVALVGAAWLVWLASRARRLGRLARAG